MAVLINITLSAFWLFWFHLHAIYYAASSDFHDNTMRYRGDNFMQCSTSSAPFSGGQLTQCGRTERTTTEEAAAAAAAAASKLWLKAICSGRNSRARHRMMYMGGWLDRQLARILHIKATAPAAKWMSSCSSSRYRSISRKETKTRLDWWKKTRLLLTCRAQPHLMSDRRRFPLSVAYRMLSGKETVVYNEKISQLTTRWSENLHLLTVRNFLHCVSKNKTTLAHNFPKC